MRTKGLASAVPPQFASHLGWHTQPGRTSGFRANGLTRAGLLFGKQPNFYGIFPGDFSPGLLRRLPASGAPSLSAPVKPTPPGESF